MCRIVGYVGANLKYLVNLTEWKILEWTLISFVYRSELLIKQIPRTPCGWKPVGPKELTKLGQVYVLLSNYYPIMWSVAQIHCSLFWGCSTYWDMYVYFKSMFNSNPSINPSINPSSYNAVQIIRMMWFIISSLQDILFMYITRSDGQRNKRLLNPKSKKCLLSM